MIIDKEHSSLSNTSFCNIGKITKIHGIRGELFISLFLDITKRILLIDSLESKAKCLKFLAVQEEPLLKKTIFNTLDDKEISFFLHKNLSGGVF